MNVFYFNVVPYAQMEKLEGADPHIDTGQKTLTTWCLLHIVLKKRRRTQLSEECM